MKKTWKTIYEVIYEKYFDESRIKFPKYFLTEYKMEFNVPHLIPLKFKNKI